MASIKIKFHLVITSTSLNNILKSRASGQGTLSKFTKQVSIDSRSISVSISCRTNALSIVDALNNSALSNWQKK